MECATTIAEEMVKYYGMSDIVGLRTICNLDEAIVSDELKSRMDSEIDRLLEESHSRVVRTLTDHWEELVLIAKALMVKKTLFANEIQNMIENMKNDLKAKKNENIPFDSDATDTDTKNMNDFKMSIKNHIKVW